MAGRPGRQGQRRCRRPGQAVARCHRLRRAGLCQPEQAALRRHEEFRRQLYHAAIDSVTAALATAQTFRTTSASRWSIRRATRPIRSPGTTWVLVYQQQKDPRQGQEAGRVPEWAFTDGETWPPTLDYAPLPENVQQRVLERIDDD